MSQAESSPDKRSRRPSRRSLLLGGGAAAVVAKGSSQAGGRAGHRTDQPGGSAQVAFHGEHQAGIDTLPVQAHALFLGLDLRDRAATADVRRLMRMLSDDAARLTSGRPPLGAEDGELSQLPSRLTVTFGFGAGVFDAIGRSADCPDVVRNLPHFATDRLQPRWSGADLLVQVCCDDPLTLAYAARRLVRDARSITTVRWSQRGFNQARGSEPHGTTPRNLLGQRDGSANPGAGTQALADAVWIADGPEWSRGGSMLVLRRIRMDLDAWDDFGREGKELSLARRLDTGAPVTGGTERDAPDVNAVDAQGLPIVASEAHVMRATHRAPSERMLRRGFSYDDGPSPDGTANAGLLFAAYQADAALAFVPVQRRLAHVDALNQWTTHIGSAAFMIPPGCSPGQFVGHQLIGDASAH